MVRASRSHRGGYRFNSCTVHILIMFLKSLKPNEKIKWTQHSKGKMRQYQLSEKRVLRVLRKPDRKEYGIAPKTIAVMQTTGSKKHPTEIWLMYQTIKSIIRIISTWRYPGVSPKGKSLPIPDDILNELDNLIKNKEN